MTASPGFPWPPRSTNHLAQIIAPPHLDPWANQVAEFLKDKIASPVLGFSTSGSSGGGPKAILFTPDALEHCARGAILHMEAQTGDWCCPLPLWHIGGVMTIIRSSLAGTRVFHLEGKWNAHRYTQLMKETKASWSSLVPAQVTDIVQHALKAPAGIRSILVGGGSLDIETGRKARTLGWPVVQSYGMTEAGSQIATAKPDEPFHTDKLSILPHWEVKTGNNGRLAIRGKGRFFGIVSSENNTLFFDKISPDSWWENNDIVSLHNKTLTFLRRADRVIKILGELVDPDAMEESLRRQFGHILIEVIPAPRKGYELVACHPDGNLLKKACSSWNASCPGFQKIHFWAEIEAPTNSMGKIDRVSLKNLIKASLFPI